KSRIELLSEYILAQIINLLSQEAPRADVINILDQIDPETFQAHTNILATLKSALHNNKDAALNDIALGLHETDREEFDRINLTPIQSELTEAGKMSHSIDEQLLDVKQAIRELQRLHIKNQ